ncbi:hypothetical protein LEP1GSC060_1439 [Leptospira weilii serovar Ranarum str. ICFT]|uniref:Uncharacterized protein n=1 Tax=Leptospira weilii serovar Ranarum str. ICFT TaxID=1218598 RepID=N1WLD2_9LEPT|nr:hypothetical protein LEP1GSC060_1439 [Leptospira weilii serovar Ranarum str. ICFT]
MESKIYVELALQNEGRQHKQSRLNLRETFLIGNDKKLHKNLRFGWKRKTADFRGKIETAPRIL